MFERILTLTKPDGILTTLEQEAVDIILLDMNFSFGVNNGQEGLLWVQAGSIITTTEVAEYADAQIGKPVTINVYPGMQRTRTFIVKTPKDEKRVKYYGRKVSVNIPK